MIKKTPTTWPWCCSNFAVLPYTWRPRQTELVRLGFCFMVLPINQQLIQSWLVRRYLGHCYCFFKQILCNFSTKFLLLLWQELQNQFCCQTFHAEILCQNFWNAKSKESLDFILIPTLSIIKPFQSFCLLKAFQNMIIFIGFLAFFEVYHNFIWCSLNHP